MEHNPEKNMCPFFLKSNNKNCYHKNLNSLSIRKVLKYCNNEFTLCPVYEEKNILPVNDE